MSAHFRVLTLYCMVVGGGGQQVAVVFIFRLDFRFHTVSTFHDSQGLLKKSLRTHTQKNKQDQQMMQQKMKNITTEAKVNIFYFMPI